MKIQSITNRAIGLLLVICMVFGLVIIPTGLDEGTHVHAASSSTVAHNCTLANDGYTLDQDTMDFFVANGINVGGHDFANGPLVVAATEEIHWTGKLTVPDGMFIGICTGGFDYSMGDFEFEGRGGVYLLDCSKTLTEHKDCQAFADESVLHVTQNIINLYEDWAIAYNINQPILNQNMSIALAENITFKTNILAPAEGYSRNICKNGYTLTFGEGVDFTAYKGTVNILDCQNMPKLVHNCDVAHFGTDPITQGNIATYVEQLPYIPDGNIVCMHLAEDVEYNGTISVPDGVIVAICLNGFTLSGLTVDGSLNTRGGFFTYDCDEHTCRIGGERLNATYVLTQNVVNFLEAAYEIDPNFIEDNPHYALSEDVTLKSEMWVASYNESISFCKNGHKINDEVGINLSQGSIIYIDCGKMTMGDLAHEGIVSLLLGGESYPMTQETLNDFDEALKPFLYSYDFNYNQYSYWSYLGSDGTPWYIDNEMVNRYISPVSFTQNKDNAYYFYGGMCSVYDSNNYVSGNAYAYSGNGIYRETETSTSGYTVYLLPAKAEDGSIYLALVNSYNLTYNSETGEYFLQYMENEETITVPVYMWDNDYTVNGLKVDVDGVTYYLACDAANGFYLDAVDNYSAEKLPAYYDYRYRFNGDEGICVFHLSEDVSWEGTLTVPAGQILIILTNGHTANGDYVHNDYGGVYVFNDNIHVCPSAPDSSVTITSDFIDIMLLISGGQLDMPSRQYVSLGEDITSINPAFVLPSTTTLYICCNGYKISDEVVAQLTSGGGNVEFVDCDDLSHDSCEKLGNVDMQPVNQNLMVNFYQNSKGYFQLGGGTYYLYLTSDIKLEKELIIPAGVEIYLCLNGYTLKSPKIVTEKINIGGSSTPIPEDEICNGAIFIEKGAKLVVYDCSPSGMGCIAPDLEEMNGLGALAAYAVSNDGVFILDSGNLFGMAPLLNSGEAEINGGKVYGVLAAVIHGTAVTEDSGETGENTAPNLVINDGEIVSVLIGIAGTDGEVTVNDGSIFAGVVGVGSNLGDDLNSNEGSDLVLNGGSVNVGTINVENYLKFVDKVGNPLTDEELEKILNDVEQTENGEIALGNEEIYGVIANQKLTISEDFEINVNEEAEAKAEKSADLVLGSNVVPNVIPSKNGEGNGNSFSTSGNISTLPDGSIGSTFTPAKGEAFEEDENGDTVIVDVTTTATLIGRTLTLNGLINLNLFMTLSNSFVSNENARVKVTFAGKTTEYKVSDLRKNGSYRVVSIGVPAKDYCEKPIVTFTDGMTEWTTETAVDASVNGYLDQLLADTSGAYDSAKDLASHIKNYCMASATLFLGTEYTPTAEIAQQMGGIDMEIFKNYKGECVGTSDKVTMPGVTLLLEAGTTIRFYIQAADGVDMNTVDVYVDGVATKATLYNRAQRSYYVEVENIAAKDLATFHTVEVDGISLSYSAISYCYSVFRTKDTQPTDLLDICRALYGYYEAAYNYEINK